ncbi:MAG TPA: hypothetical protein VI306_07370 [Pyrinomonadaceae bacterium]
MPLGGPAKLGILTFPQAWEPNRLRVRFLCMPKASPFDPLAVDQPTFAEANLIFEANIIPGLDRLPRAQDAIGLGELVIVSDPPVQKEALFDQLKQQFNIQKKARGIAVKQRFLKPVTESYLALTGTRQLSDFLANDKDFECALHDSLSSQPAKPEVLTDEVSWGQLMAYALRQPKLAIALGLIREATIDLDDPTVFEKGGWLYISLHATSDYAAVPEPPPFKALYAAQIPPLNQTRSLYAAVLFPVDGGGVADDIFREAERYDLGFARMVHCAQVHDRGDAIRLAWDDEQIAEWLNRQTAPTTEAPMGTAGYRIDVRIKDGAWNSLVQVRSKGDLTIGPLVLGPYSGESVVEVMPAQIAPARMGEYWMPSYFTTWRGSSLVLTDNNLTLLHQHPELLARPEAASLLLNRETNFVAVDDTLVPLRYGKTYEFRVRLADLTFGGPPSTDDTPLLPHAITTILFQRYSRPGQIGVTHRPTRAEKFITIEKPRLGYPEAMFAGVENFQDLTDELDADILAGREREMSVPDPDVIKVEVLVEVRALEGDVDIYLPLYTTTREFNADTITLDLELQDLATLDLLAVGQPEDGPLAIPTARDIRIRLVGIGKEDPGYFVNDDTRRGTPVTLDLRAPATTEAPLFATVESPLRSFFFQPTPADGSVATPAQRLATELELDHSALSFTGRPGHRTIFAASAALRHTLSPECASITFSSGADVIQRWVNVVRLKLARDWTWNGLTEEGIAIQRRVKIRGKADIVELAGTIRLPHALVSAARSGVSSQVRDVVRQSTEIFFFDAFDPKPRPGPAPPAPPEFPTEFTFEYEISAEFKDNVPAPGPATKSINVPVATPPTQVPKLISAGIALSPYVKADDYSASAQRQRSLWFEFESAPLDPDDSYFVRILANAPDPLLIAIDEVIPEVVEPSLSIDPEWMRLIEQDQPRDDNGLRAMDLLDKQAEAGIHFLVPLPKGLNESSLELFGMYSYEIRVGHNDRRWSLAQARFGPPLRVAGVPHPAPPLVCQAARGEFAIRVRAPYATAVHDGRNVRPRFPRTSMWAVLYARIKQTDAASWRNLLLDRAPMSPGQVFDNEADGRTLFGQGLFEIVQVKNQLQRLGLPDDTPLTTLAVEFFTDPIPPDPLGDDLGLARMLRVSPLVPVPDSC